MKKIIEHELVGRPINPNAHENIFDFVKDIHAGINCLFIYDDGQLQYHVDALCDGEAMKAAGITNEMQETVDMIYEVLAYE